MIKQDGHGNLKRKRVEIPITPTTPQFELRGVGMNMNKIVIDGKEKDLISISINWDNGRGRVVYWEYETEEQ